MIDPLNSAMTAASSALHSQAKRMNIISQNLANAQSTGNSPGADPYARKLITFAETLDRATGAARVEVSSIRRDTAPFRLEYRPDHPAADGKGYVKLPNVNPIIEVADMQDALRLYQADVQVIKQTKSMYAMLSDLLRR
jgi:flagellar basal-body rod protein FlgC